jgi:hypothetical protein
MGIINSHFLLDNLLPIRCKQDSYGKHDDQRRIHFLQVLATESHYEQTPFFSVNDRTTKNQREQNFPTSKRNPALKLAHLALAERTKSFPPCPIGAQPKYKGKIKT